ncbi:MAG: hypothetical protein P4L59_21945 [Desulfosporosinus sp.]|nr:hypothetical protein [Desulfosporosinus sp.]
MQKCPCGSGKLQEVCHGEITDLGILRKTLKTDMFRIGDSQVAFNRVFEPKEFEQKRFKCTVRIYRSTTPAGEILYPTLITVKNKSLRPLSLDGLQFAEEGTKIIQDLQGMITPNSTYTLRLEIPKNNPLLPGYHTLQGYVITVGDPFDSVFALETRDNRIALYHHTNSEAKQAILSSRQFKGSKWNYQGTQEFDNINYIYFTDITQIIDSIDLADIGMADKGTRLGVLTDRGEVQELEVYRDNPLSRCGTLKVWVEPDMLDPNPLILHDIESHTRTGPFGGFSWWEVFFPSIFRVGVTPNRVLKIKGKDNLYLTKDDNFMKNPGFIAAYGNDLIGLTRVWSEVPAEKIERPNHELRPADLGLPDEEWIRVWSRNLSSISASILRKSFS